VGDTTVKRTSTAASTERGEERRRQLVAKAAALFDEVGYHRASVEDVAEACGIRKPTLYHYFKGKEEILYWIHDEFIDLLIARQRAREPLGLSASQGLLEIMADILDLVRTHKSYVRVFFEHYRELDETHKAAIRKKRDLYEQSVHRVIQSGVDNGEFRDVDVKTVTLVVAGMCNWAYQWYEPTGPLTSREVAYVFWELLVRGLRQ
jgi:TetR/AcrR family transcriptional regulator, cholesterol catabolism regulator